MNKFNRFLLLMCILSLTLSLSGCYSEQPNVNIDDTNPDATIMESKESEVNKESNRFSFFSSKDLNSLVSVELNSIDKNPWLDSSVLSDVNCKNIRDLIDKNLDENEVQKFLSSELTYIDSYNDYNFFTYEESGMNIDDSLKYPFDFTFNLDTNYISNSPGVVLDRWDETKHYLFGVACGFKSYIYKTESMETDTLRGDVVVRCFNAEELAELLPCDLSLEEQAELIKNNVYFTSGVKVSNKYFRLYQYIYSECGYKFLNNGKEINLNNLESNYAFVIKEINKNDRTVIIEFTGETLLDREFKGEV